MDPTRFDALARRWGATRRSRRTLLQALAGSSLAAATERITPSDRPDVAAKARTPRRSRRRATDATDGAVAPRTIGLPCVAAQEQHVGPPYGPLCGKTLPVAKQHPPYGCCPGSSCLNVQTLQPVKGKKRGRCYCDRGYEPDETTDGFCRVIAACVPVRGACGEGDTCCAIASGDTTCGSVSFHCTGTAEPRCCRREGAPCSHYCDCCGTILPGPGDTDCVDGVCTACGVLNAACATSNSCCARDNGVVVCALVPPEKGNATGGTTVCPTGDRSVPQCCLGEGARCADDCQCCAMNICQGGACVVPTQRCHPLGESCADGASCCTGAGTCHNGHCCLSDGASCPAGCPPNSNCPTCCSGSCDSAGRCGAPQGCLAYGAFCSTNAECCNDVPCTAGRCHLP